MDVQKAKSDVGDSKLAFWFNNGLIVRNLEELARALETLDSKIFKYHVNSQKNDVYNWVLDVFADDVLAEVIKNEFNQKRLAQKVATHIKFLKEPGKVPLAPKTKPHKLKSGA